MVETQNVNLTKYYWYMVILGGYVARVWLISLTLRVPTNYVKKKKISPVGKYAKDINRQFKGKKKKDKKKLNFPQNKRKEN